MQNSSYMIIDEFVDENYEYFELKMFNEFN